MSGAAPLARAAGIRELANARLQLARICAQLVLISHDHHDIDPMAMLNIGQAAGLLMKARERLHGQMIELEMHDTADKQPGDKHE
jgi:pyrrolidone-carboxylate peptidase